MTAQTPDTPTPTDPTLEKLQAQYNDLAGKLGDYEYRAMITKEQMRQVNQKAAEYQQAQAVSEQLKEPPNPTDDMKAPCEPSNEVQS